MGINKRQKSSGEGRSSSTKSKSNRRKSLFNLISPSEVTEKSLQVWRGLPSKIRHDPSLASFQIEHERLHGTEPETLPKPVEEIELAEVEADDDQENEDEDSNDSEFITMKSLSDGTGNKHDAELNGEGGTKAEEDVGGASKQPNFKKYSKILFLLLIWFIASVSLVISSEKHLNVKQVVVPEGPKERAIKYFYLCESPSDKHFQIHLTGAFLSRKYHYIDTPNYLKIEIEIVESPGCNRSDVGEVEFTVDEWVVPIAYPEQYDNAILNQTSHRFELSGHERLALDNSNKKLRLKMYTSNFPPFPFKISYDSGPVDLTIGTIYAAATLVLLYVLVIWEIVHRTFAAIISSVMSIGIMSALGDRPSMEEIVEWMDIESILLLFSMMIIIAILTETGIFDHIAVYIFKVTGGKVWPLIHSLCIVTCLISTILDNVTTVLLMTPITIRLCEVMHLDPVPALLGVIVHSNIGGTLTPIGDPPNVIITSNTYISHNGVTFFTFIEHMILGVILVTIQSCIHLRIIFRDTHALRHTEPKEVKQIRREMQVWQRAAASLSSYSKDVDLVRETLLKKVKILKQRLKKLEVEKVISTDDYQHNLEELAAAYPIKNKPLLIKSGFVLLFVVALFFIQSSPSLQRLSLGWASLLGVILLLIIADRDDMDALMSRIEWTTLLFFAAMFVTMESLERLGLINFIGGLTEKVISYVPEKHRLGMAILIILWVSALTSAFVESILITAMMLKVVLSIHQSLSLPLQPLVWALAFGPCLGGNGTLYGNSANIVCAGIAEQHGYEISFGRFFKVVFPMMIGSIVVVTAYLMIAHQLFAWH